jgi:anaerobic magnesium-protoporphyrin IX monomethyl ester cyclase
LKVILINPPSPYLDNDAAYPPSGLMYLASAIERGGHEAIIIDLSGNSNWEQDVCNLDADLFGITCVTPNFNIVSKISNLLPPKKPVVIGGPHATFLPLDVLHEIKCNAVVLGEGEDAILHIIRDLKQKKKLDGIYNGGILPISVVPKPARHLVNLSKYRSIPVYTSRGCYYNCNFCSKIAGSDFRAFPVQRVLEEIHDVLRMGYNYIVFGDDNIRLSKSLKDLLQEVAQLKISFRLNQDARSVDKDILKLAREAGCTEISFGVESGSQKMLDLMNKKLKVEENERAIEQIKEQGILTKAYFIVNFPGETEETVEETLKFIEEAKPDKWFVSSFAPLPGSDVFSYPDKYGILWMSSNWGDYYLVGKDGSFNPCFETKELSCEKQVYFHGLLFSELKKLDRSVSKEEVSNES